MNNLDVLLINAPSPNPGSILSHRVQGLPPLGICYIATFLNSKGYRAGLLDFYIRSVSMKDLLNSMNRDKPGIIGISTTTETYKSGMRLAGVIKQLSPSATVVMGGCHVTFEYEEALSSGNVDYAVRGEGEITFYELCNYLLRGEGDLKNINGISYMQDGRVVSNPAREFICDLDSLPFPDRSLFDLDKYSYPASISTSRGCPGRCIFCAAAALSGGRYRIRSAESIVDEIEYLVSLGYDHIHFIDDTMTAHRKRLNEIIELIISRGLSISWAGESRVDGINKEMLKKMYASGCRGLQFGVEAGNQEMLDSLKKNITLEQVRNVFGWCAEIGIRPSSCLIIGQPFDTESSIRDTINIGLELQSLGAQIVFSISTPYPGTYMYNHAEELGLRITDHDTDNYTTQTPVYDTANLSAAEIRNFFYHACVLLAKNNRNEGIKAKFKSVRDEALSVTAGGL